MTPYPTTDFHHLLQFYKNEQLFISSLAEYFQKGLDRGETCIAIATPEHRAALKKALSNAGCDVDFKEMIGQIQFLDAKSTLAHFMVGDMPDAQSFDQVIGSLVPRFAEGRIRAFGEMVVLLWEQGNYAGAIALEELWNELGQVRNFTLLCAYPEDVIYKASPHAHPGDINRVHSGEYSIEPKAI